MSISLVVPVKNEARTITELLDSISRQQLMPEEIVITDSGSDDETCKLIESYNKRLPIKLVKAGEATPGKARNLAIQNSRCEFIAMTDAGIRLEKGWLENLARPMKEDPTVDMVYGHYEPVADTFFKRCAEIAYTAKPRLVKDKWVRTDSIASALMKKAV